LECVFHHLCIWNAYVIFDSFFLSSKLLLKYMYCEDPLTLPLYTLSSSPTSITEPHSTFLVFLLFKPTAQPPSLKQSSIFLSNNSSTLLQLLKTGTRKRTPLKLSHLLLPVSQIQFSSILFNSGIFGDLMLTKIELGSCTHPELWISAP